MRTAPGLARGDGAGRAGNLSGGVVLVGVAAALGCHLGSWLDAATRQWFTHDDFPLLAHVQSVPPGSWFLPGSGRLWSFYRPLGVDAFYYAGVNLFGLDWLGYGLASLGLSLATGAILYRLAVGLGLSSPVAALSAAFSVTRDGVAVVTLFPAAFHYVSASFFITAAVLAFLRYLRGGGARWQVLSGSALALGLFCNQVALTTPAVLLALALHVEERPAGRAAWRRAGRRVAPAVAVVAVFLVYRFGFLPWPVGAAFYGYSIGGHLLGNAGSLVLRNAAGWPGLVGIAVLAGAAALAVARTDRRRAPRRLLGVFGVAAVWLVASLLPYLPLPVAAPRVSAPSAVPLALLLGVVAELLWRSSGARQRVAVAAALSALLVASLPIGLLRLRAERPLGARPRQLYQVMRALAPPGERTDFFLFAGAPGLARSGALKGLENRIWGAGAFPRATFPDGSVRLTTVSLAEDPAAGYAGVHRQLRLAGDGEGRCVHLILGDDRRVRLASRAWADRAMPGRLARRCTVAAPGGT